MKMSDEYGPVDLTELEPDKLRSEDILELEKRRAKLEQCRDENGRVAEKLLVQVNEAGLEPDRLEKVRRVIAENFGDTGAIEPNDIHELMDELEECKTENKELWAVFNLQQTRLKKAQRMWRRATGRHNTLPDLGELLDWLMAENDKMKWLKHLWRQELAEVKKQKNHRKWALQELYMMRSVADQCDEDKHGIVHG